MPHGRDIHGWVEVRWGSADPTEWRRWTGGIDVRSILGGARDYELWGCSFGVRGSYEFVPVAAYRGLPEDLSDRARGRLSRNQQRRTRPARHPGRQLRRAVHHLAPVDGDRADR